MTKSLEGSPTKANEAPSPHEVRLVPLDTNPVFPYLGDHSKLLDYLKLVLSQRLTMQPVARTTY